MHRRVSLTHSVAARVPTTVVSWVGLVIVWWLRYASNTTTCRIGVASTVSASTTGVELLRSVGSVVVLLRRSISCGLWLRRLGLLCCCPTCIGVQSLIDTGWCWRGAWLLFGPISDIEWLVERWVDLVLSSIARRLRLLRGLGGHLGRLLAFKLRLLLLLIARLLLHHGVRLVWQWRQIALVGPGCWLMSERWCRWGASEIGWRRPKSSTRILLVRQPTTNLSHVHLLILVGQARALIGQLTAAAAARRHPRDNIRWWLSLSVLSVMAPRRHWNPRRWYHPGSTWVIMNLGTCIVRRWVAVVKLWLIWRIAWHCVCVCLYLFFKKLYKYWIKTRLFKF